MTLQNSPASVTCPLTGSTDVTLIEVWDSNELIHAWQQEFHLDIFSELRPDTRIELYQSNTVNLHFFFPRNLAGSGKFYSQLQCFPWYYRPNRWEHQQAYSDLRKHSQTVLEIGAGTGSFVEHCLQIGLQARGIELNPQAIAEAQSRQLPISAEDLAALATANPESFDAVCSFQVLEHVAEPRAFLDRALQLLKPSGYLILGVPNRESFLQHYRRYLLDMPPHHLTRWSEATFAALEEILPVRLLKVRREPLDSAHVNLYLKVYYQYFNAHSWLARLAFNRYLLPTYHVILYAGWRHLLVGMGLYVVLQKLSN